MSSRHAQVVIAGGGPVGMTLALELARHGIASVLLERNRTTTQHPKMDLTNGRSMELYRRLGVADELRTAGVPSDRPLDIVWATCATGETLHRFRYPSPDETRTNVRTANDGTGTAEPSLRISQILLEPALKRHIDASPLVDVRFGWAYEAHQQDAEGVTVTAEAAESGERVELRCSYLVGCDGGGSRVRRNSGIGLEGQHAIGAAYMVHFRSTDRDALCKFGDYYHLQTGSGTVIAQDGSEVWTLQAVDVPPNSDPAELMRNFIGRDADYEILVANPWTPHMVLAERYRDRRVFLAGDAAHQVVPTGGYGMNTGVCDAVDLGWKLAAVLNGWGGPRLLDSYEVERLPIAAQNRGAALRHAMVRMEITALIRSALAESTNTSRIAEVGARIEQLGNAENESWGIEFGYNYYGSPVVASEAEAPGFDPMRFIVQTNPGVRLPHFHLADGRSLHDLLGKGFSLVVSGGADCGDVVAEARKAGVPLTIVPLHDSHVSEALATPLILVRPDHHIAWRGQDCPPRWEPILTMVSGA